jgi:hypothetical protein
MRNRITAAILPVLVLLSLSAPASANIGVPMIFITLPAMMFALLPIILVESYVLIRRLALPGGTAVKLSTIGNLASTLVGMPVTWFVLVLLQMGSGGGAAPGIDSYLDKLLAVTWQAAWPVEYRGHTHWIIPAATLTLMVPFFFASWLVEYLVAKWFLASSTPLGLSAAVRTANLVSYGLLAALVVFKLLFFRQSTFLI